MAKIGIIYGSNKGETKEAAEYIANNFDSDLINVVDLTAEFLTKFDKFILIASTHGNGELQKDFRAKANLLSEFDFNGKTVALVGVGGQVKHSTTFVSGLVEFLPLVKGANLIGQSDIDGYNFKYSASLINGKFIGGILDLNNDKSWKARADKWIASVKDKF